MLKYKSLMRNISGSRITCSGTSTFKQCILTINQYKESSFDRICKERLYDENNILIGFDYIFLVVICLNFNL